jgi:hypothetical protein
MEVLVDDSMVMGKSGNMKEECDAIQRRHALQTE